MPYKDPKKAADCNRISAREYWRRKHANAYRQDGRPQRRNLNAKSYKQEQEKNESRTN